MRPEELADGIQTILSHSHVFPGCSLTVDIIANPKAGGFKLKNFSKKRRSEMKSLVDKALSFEKRQEPLSVRLHLTERGGHAAAIMQRLLERSEANGKDSRHLIMTAGGDGTSLETAERLACLPESEKDRFAILRLPMGTGNDGSEGRDLVTALGRFFRNVKLERRPAVHVTPSDEGGQLPLYAFNIASLGLDAYVAEMTNRLKARFPGDSYKFWVDVATILYDKVYRVVPMHTKVWDNDGKLVSDETKARLFLAFGASGFRQYGSNKRILPGPDNALLLSQTSLLRKMMIKTPIEKGSYQGFPEAESFLASKVEVDYDQPILLQCDGEIHPLAHCDFPLTLEVVKDLYNVIVPA
ncbi:MAG: diacylglycerol kinase [Spirochaetaceae bacterium]|nr:diacylglycerol kinase [Spirochaetaceae bacterium]